MVKLSERFLEAKKRVDIISIDDAITYGKICALEVEEEYRGDVINVELDQIAKEHNL